MMLRYLDRTDTVFPKASLTSALRSGEEL